MPTIEHDMCKRIETQQLGGPVYLFTNENIGEYLSYIPNMRGARVLAVTGSGDHAFHAYMMGAAHVDTFDFNIYQKSVMDLKLEMIHKLDYAQFRDFFEKKIRYFYTTPKDFDIMNDVTETLSPSAKTILNAIRKHGASMIRESGRYPQYSGLYATDPKRYEQLKSALPERINFTHADIFQLPQRFHEKYDIILLSNIFTYLYPTGQNTATLMQMYNDILQPLAKNNLTDNGQIYAHYCWGLDYMSLAAVYWERAVKQVNEEIIANNHKFDLQYIDSFERGCTSDIVTIMQNINSKTR